MLIRPTRLESLQEETKSELQNYITTEWPENMQDLPERCFRDERTILDGLLMKGNRLLVPASMLQGTLHRLHEGHHGLSAMLRTARCTAFWPKLQEDISKMSKQCVCVICCGFLLRHNTSYSSCKA